MINWKSQKKREFDIGDKVEWKNKNTNTVESGIINSIVDDKIIAIGGHQVSWTLIEDIEIKKRIDQ